MAPSTGCASAGCLAKTPHKNSQINCVARDVRARLSCALMTNGSAADADLLVLHHVNAVPISGWLFSQIFITARQENPARRIFRPSRQNSFENGFRRSPIL